ncbi:hypothetical protein K504DRAFT_337429, partial [Pleomassaria siparia CBS 279.74]
SSSQFQFISIQNPDEAKNRTTRRLAKSHAVARGIQNKRKLRGTSGYIFRPVSTKDDFHVPPAKKKKGTVSQAAAATSCSSSSSPTAVAPDPFHMLAAESPTLQAWHSLHRSQQAIEPVFSISDELVLPNFRSVLRKGLDDRALLNAIMLTIACAVTSNTGSIDGECLGYQSEALNSIRQRLSSPDRATLESTLGAILLLAGVGVC